MGITIKQLANELGVSKPTISNVIVQLNLWQQIHSYRNTNRPNKTVLVGR